MSTGDDVRLDTPEDDALLAHLRRIAHDVDPPPALMDELARGAFLLRTLDAELAALVHDSAEPGQELAGVRGDDSVRLLSYEVEAVGLELQVVARGPYRSLTGQVFGPVAGPVLVQTGAGEHALDPDQTGVFALEDLAAGRVRVSLTRAGGVTVVTPWTVL